ncbi:hypothetical protein F5X71_04680 [Nocardia brasiliensis]|uniref:Uncharacterized protein n=1 Tax=Nocardia brasiliensis TaxID=37326 RepID=A0A6G9XLD7_NOCBR|nr:hypothetical protein [Nocardia brasiliensis]QIS01699.1 hypothetical protein F5X71_04680 [Nocardia brasiliensis]
MTRPDDEAAQDGPRAESATDREPSEASSNAPTAPPSEPAPLSEGPSPEQDAFMRRYLRTVMRPAADEPSGGASATDDEAARAEFMRQFFDSLATESDVGGNAAELLASAGVEPPDGDDPDVGFTLMGAAPPQTEDVGERTSAISHQVARELGAGGPEGWTRLEATFAMAVGAEVALVVFTDEQGRVARAFPPDEVLALVREHRHLSARLSDGPWWRYLLTLTNTGEVEVDYDYGDEPFPDDQLFAPEIYRADLEVYPRATLPIWLAAYLGHGDRQSRTPLDAAIQARADRDTGRRGVLSEHDFPAFPLMAARWAVIAAAFVAAGSELGPRVLPSMSWFEGLKRSGSTLYSLPGGRAVLSGGVWNAPALARAYNDGEPMPRLYAGAPEWVANPVLNARVAGGLLSFCYWWEGGNWYRGESPIADELSDAVPGMWTSETVVDIVCGVLGDEVSERQRAAAATLVSAAEIGVVTRATLADVFGADGEFDVDSAFFQLSMAGVTMTLPEPMPQEDALARVRQFVIDSGMQTSRYPLSDLRAERISIGWMVYVPTKPGEIAIGRAIFYVADDGVLEQSSSSVAPSIFIAEFEQRFQQRHSGVEA